MAGTLYIVATPIGNLGDMTYRATEVLQNVDLILCEDTRHSKPLLEHYNITCPLKSLHEHNEHKVTQSILDQLATKDIALISDAGTPLISDPGYILVAETKRRGIQVVPLPGASSVITALSAAGLPSNNFCFTGFLPTKSSAKARYLRTLEYATTTTICFESPKRIMDTMSQMSEIFATDRIITIAKELTKHFETITTGTCQEILRYLSADTAHTKGEFVVLISPNDSSQGGYQQLPYILEVLGEELPKSQAAKIAAKLTGISKAECYDALMKHNNTS